MEEYFIGLLVTSKQFFQYWQFSSENILKKGLLYRTVERVYFYILLFRFSYRAIFGKGKRCLCRISLSCFCLQIGKRGNQTAMRLANKVALITGSARGMGKVAAELFAREGASIIVTDIAQQEGEAVAQGIRDAGGQAVFVPADVTRGTEVEALVEAGIAAYGKIDILYNNAGIMPNADGSVLDITEELWDTVMVVNLKSAFLCSKYVIPHMLKQGQGSIVNISSMNALLGCVVAQDAYTASKGGILALTKSLAVQFGRQGIRCNAICPGPINTGLLDHLWTSEEAKMTRLNRIPAGRFGLPEDVVYMALYLSSDEATWTNGAQLNVDGGITANYF